MPKKSKKDKILGINASTARYRLVKILLWEYICAQGHANCCICGEEMSLKNFTIEHRKPWASSEDPLRAYFDLANIGFACLSCNSRRGR